MGTFPNPDQQFRPGESGNPAGKPPGARNWSTIIRSLIEDESYEVVVGKEKKKYPGKVIASVMIGKAAAGDVKAADWLAKYGYGTKVDVTSGGETIKPGGSLDITDVDKFVEQYKNDTSAVQTSTD